MAGIMTSFMIFFIRREYKVFLSKEDLKDNPKVLSVICNENSFYKIEKILKMHQPAMLFHS